MIGPREAHPMPALLHPDAVTADRRFVRVLDSFHTDDFDAVQLRVRVVVGRFRRDYSLAAHVDGWGTVVHVGLDEGGDDLLVKLTDRGRPLSCSCGDWKMNRDCRHVAFSAALAARGHLPTIH